MNFQLLAEFLRSKGWHAQRKSWLLDRSVRDLSANKSDASRPREAKGSSPLAIKMQGAETAVEEGGGEEPAM